MSSRPAARPARPAFHALFTLALTLLAIAPRAQAGGATIDPATAPLLAAQKAAAMRITQAGIWAGARAQFHEARELAELRRRARHGDRAALRGLRVRRIGGDDGPPIDEPVPAPLPGTRPLAAQHAFAAPTNARCNDPSHDGTAAAQSECMVGAIGNQVVVDWNNGQGFYVGADVQGFGWSNDGGLTYTDGGAPVHPAGYPNFRWRGDPNMAANERTGELWLCGLATTDGAHNALAVARGRFTAGTFAFDSAWVVRAAPNASIFLDKEWLACDSTTGNLYVVNTTFGSADTIDFYRSTDGGRSWSSPVTLSSNLDAGYVQGARVAVAGNGDVEVAWYAGDQVTVESDLRFRRSTDGGQSFLPEVTPATFNEQFGTGAPGFNRDWGPNFPSLAVDRSSGPHRGRIYLAWPECWRFLATPVPVGPAALEAEPNGSAASATPFTVGQSLRGTLTASVYAVPDQDWWSFPLAAGQTMIVFADSVQTDALGHGWILRLVAPDGSQRLCRGGASDSTQNRSTSFPGQAYYTFTAPAAGTYFLALVATSYRPTSYAIKTVIGVPGSERGRDQRDGFAAWSDDGATWSAPVRMNDDAIGFDQWLPELAAGADGAAYATWFDHRDDPYGARTNVDGSRSTDGGATWAANQLFSDIQGNFTTAGSNIAPNMGDYIGLASSGTRLVAAWGDARATSSVDLWSAAIDLTSDIASCARDTALAPHASVTPNWSFVNHDALFGGNYAATLTSARNWPLPASAGVAIGPGATQAWSATIAVPDTAANGVNAVCLTLATPAGVVARRCCFNLTVQGSLAGVDGGAGALALARPWPNPTAGGAELGFTLPRAGTVRLTVFDLAGARIRTLWNGPRPAGEAVVRWDGHDDHGRAVHPGAYFYRLEFEGHTLAQRIVLTR